ncbi:MAG: Protein of unknown function periplasmic [Parcubacteria group bacterium]|nr:Protein of unknown function periplasmic [Parcubacteria group bacterium]
MKYKGKNRIIVLAVLIVLGVAYWFFYRGQMSMDSASSSTSTEQGAPLSAMFVCTHSASIGAEFTDRAVALSLSDGRNLTLPQTVSGSGARYANSDESFVFWNKGNTAFIEENGRTTFAGCVAAAAE